MNKLLSLALILVATVLLASQASAATITYWRFEDSPGFLSDSAGSNTLTNNGSVTQVSTPFSNPIPQTGAANVDAASFSGSNYLTAADNAAFTSNTFTLEAFFTTANVTSTSTQIIAGHFGSGGSFANQRSYAIGINSSRLRLLLGQPAGDTVATWEAFTLTNNANYYAAAAVDVSIASPTAITLYLMDLSTSIVQVANFGRAGDVGPAITNIFNAAAPFSIGSNAQGSSNFTGRIDEVRLSNTKLAESDLLIIPEPGSFALALVGGVMLLCLRRRHTLR